MRWTKFRIAIALVALLPAALVAADRLQETTTVPTTVPTTEPTRVPTTEPTRVPTTEPGAADSTVPVNLPVVKFFFYDDARVEWIVSAEPARLDRHLASNSESQALFEAVSTAASSAVETTTSSAQMTRWIEAERQRFEQSRREAVRIRMAEAVLAYLRDHDFDVQKLVAAIQRRSGASNVDLVAIHLRDRQGRSTFKLKVMLVDPDLEIGKQGINIDLPSANVSYTTVAYALGVALYEIQEIVYGEAPPGEQRMNEAEQLPPPEPVDPP